MKTRRRGVAKTNPAAARLDEWHAHVTATPMGFVPQIMNGIIPVYGIAMGTAWTTRTIIERFEAAAAPRYWPEWVHRLAREAGAR